MTRRELLAALGAAAAFAQSKPRLWRSEPPADCPFGPSTKVGGVAFTGVHSNYGPPARVPAPGWADTWYPSWASEGKMYSPYTDGACPRGDGGFDRAQSYPGAAANTGCAVPAAVARQRSVDEDCIRRAQRAVSGVDMTEHMETGASLENRFPKLTAVFLGLVSGGYVSNEARPLKSVPEGS